MAEAAVERTNSDSIFFCHQCMREVLRNISDYTCSRCNSGFIEEMERPPPSSTNALSSDPVTQMSELNRSLLGPRQLYLGRPSIQNSDDVYMEHSEEEEMRGIVPSAVFHFNTGDLHQAPNLQGIINYVIQRLGSDIAGRNPVILHSNPGDYAWGAGGLDAIISQLLNHLEGTGAPPAQKEKIESLEKIQIDQTHIEKTLQCSICMDDFELGIEVRKLPCDHLYHSDCIIKWLEMHGTCPVCRKDLNGLDTSRNEDTLENSNFTTPVAENNEMHASAASSSSISNGPSTSSSFL
ncbi:E3 ubiquitin-protein ligase RNF126-like isoform X2 [Physella acuta]|uniref:E3 ubiquitin-protein ligase RNF126-like isoform X2 n=1 Tax=Physella acuta TaxID=109671 RepID=UPI0027DCB4AE|nr:E3 ubiquitin-protein ligase RNF126-like isoform X2 [Physella acuta]